MSVLPIIVVYPVSFYEARERLWVALGEVGGVEFRGWRDGDEAGVEVAWLVDPPDGMVEAVSGRGGRCLVWGADAGDRTGGRAEVRFHDVASVDAALRGEVFEYREWVGEAGRDSGGEVLASSGGNPVWVREVRAGGGVVDYLAMAPPQLEAGRLLRQHLKPWNAARLLPVLQVMREVAGAGGWGRSCRQACFIFDDPSLHWPSYGCLKFGELARHAARHGYHASMATVPRDALAVSAEARRLFARESAYLSLLFHGNDHTRHEMWLSRSEAEWLELLAEAVRRIGAFERREGLVVDRVMEAPHALVSRESFGPMGRVGIQAALVSPALAGTYAGQPGWPVSIGCRAVEPPLDGVGVLPRIPLSRYWRADVVVAAFLGQPIIVAGHHQDAAKGLDFLEEYARWVNRFDGVRWDRPAAIVRGQYEARREGSSMQVRLGARVVELEVPAGVNEVRVERPWPGGSDERLEVRWVEAGSTDASACVVGGRLEIPQACADGGRAVLVSTASNALDPERVSAPRVRVWPLARRVLAEVRDRVFPYVPAGWRRRPPAFEVALGGE